MPRLRHSPALDGAWTHDGEDYRIEDGIIEVDDPEVAREMAEHRRLELIEMDESPGVDVEETTYRCGVNDCSREVNGPEQTCWQH